MVSHNMVNHSMEIHNMPLHKEGQLEDQWHKASWVKVLFTQMSKSKKIKMSGFLQFKISILFINSNKLH